MIAVEKCEKLHGFDIGLTTYGSSYPVAWGNEALSKQTGIQGITTAYRINSGFMYINLENPSIPKFMRKYIRNISSLYHLATPNLMYGAHDQDGLIKTLYGTRYPGEVNGINDIKKLKIDSSDDEVIVKWLPCRKFNQPEPCDTLVANCYFLHLKGAWSRVMPDRIISRPFSGNIKYRYCSNIFRLYCYHYDNAIKVKYNLEY